MGAILAFVMARPAWMAAALTLLVCAGLAVQTARLAHAKADQLDPATRRKWKDEYQVQQKVLAAAQGELQACRADQTRLQLSVLGQNAAVDQFRSEADARTRAANAAATAARAGAAKLDQGLARLRGEKPAGTDLCANARSLIRRYAR